MADTLRLAEMIAVKFSHDLGGLMGSLAGVLELVAESQDPATEEIALAIETAGTLMDRLQLLRAAWGGASDAIDITMLRNYKRGVTGSQRLELDLDGLPDRAVFPSGMGRLVLNVMLLAGEALPRGGVLALSGDVTSHVIAQIAGAGAAWPPGFTLLLTDHAAPVPPVGSPRDLQIILTALIARQAGIRLSLLMSGARQQVPPLLLSAPAG